MVLTASRDGTARLWGLDGAERVVLRGHAAVYDAAFSPAGDRVVTGSEDGSLRVYWGGEGGLDPSRWTDVSLAPEPEGSGGEEADDAAA